MDEASSRFVDRIVMDKLLTEKLGTVHHYPTVRHDQLERDLFADFNALEPMASVVAESGDRTLLLSSPLACRYTENRVSRVACHDAKNPRGTILFVHGLFDDNRDMYGFLFSGILKAGYSVRLITLPFHHERTPACSRFSGEYFWSADVRRTRQALKQAVYELYQCYNWLQKATDSSVFLAGFSMGATVALTLASLCSQPRGLFAINPAGALSDVVWDSPLCRTIKEDYIAAGYRREEIASVFAAFEPVPRPGRRMSPNRVCLAYALYDEVTRQEQYDAMARTWNPRQKLQYKAGHLNTLRLPRLAEDMTRFFDSLTSTAEIESRAG